MGLLEFFNKKKTKISDFPIDNLKKRAIVAKIKTMTVYEITFKNAN